jgi:hypothetical protein
VREKRIISGVGVAVKEGRAEELLCSRVGVGGKVEEVVSKC